MRDTYKLTFEGKELKDRTTVDERKISLLQGIDQGRINDTFGGLI